MFLIMWQELELLYTECLYDIFVKKMVVQNYFVRIRKILGFM